VVATAAAAVATGAAAVVVGTAAAAVAAVAAIAGNRGHFSAWRAVKVRHALFS
jgi:hypothetical protein